MPTSAPPSPEPIHERQIALVVLAQEIDALLGQDAPPTSSSPATESDAAAPASLSGLRFPRSPAHYP